MTNVISLVKEKNKRKREVNNTFNDCINHFKAKNLKGYMIIAIHDDGDLTYDSYWDSKITSCAIIGALEVAKQKTIIDDFEDE